MLNINMEYNGSVNYPKQGFHVREDMGICDRDEI